MAGSGVRNALVCVGRNVDLVRTSPEEQRVDTEKRNAGNERVYDCKRDEMRI